jgi:TetR/AcrR family transcriptional regulator, cholesterol catabolism regulator
LTKEGIHYIQTEQLVGYYLPYDNPPKEINIKMMKNNKKIRTYSQDSDLISRRRQEISEKAIKLFIRKGYLKTTTREIAQACGMSTGALYHYIGSKEDILSILSDGFVSNLKEISETFYQKSGTDSPMEKLRSAIKNYLKRIDLIQDTILFWYQESKNLPRDALENVFYVDNLSMKIIEDILIEGCACGDFKVNNPKLAANNIIIICDDWVLKRWLLRKSFTIDEFITEQTAFILRAVGA